jgi:hypothetical protein
MLPDCVSFLAYPNLFGIKGFVVVVVAHMVQRNAGSCLYLCILLKFSLYASNQECLVHLNLISILCGPKYKLSDCQVGLEFAMDHTP